MKTEILNKIFLSILVLVFVLSGTSFASTDTDYRLQPEDVIQITVYEQPDLDTRTRVTSVGEIYFPLIGELKASGLTVRELEGIITDLLAKDYLVDPKVHVFIEEYHVKQISVLGAVNKPGKYDMFKERATTLLEAVAMAEGFKDIANVNGTRIIRTIDGEEQIIPVRVTDITKKGKKEEDEVLEPGDIVFVPESFL